MQSSDRAAHVQASVRRALRAVALMAIVMLAGCAAQTAYRDAQTLLAKDQAQEALGKLEEAVRLDPTSVPYRLEYLKTRDRLVSEVLLQAQRAREARQFDVAETAYRRALQLHASNEPAIAGIKLLERERRWDKWLSQAKGSAERKDFDAARARLRALLAENPGHVEATRALSTLDAEQAKSPDEMVLAAAYRKPVTLEFRDASLRTVFELLAKTSGLNFVFDKDVRSDQKTTVVLRNSTVEAAVARLLVTNQLEQRVLDANTVLIYPDTPAKQKDYQLLTVKSFYLSHAEAKSVSATLKSLLKVKDVVIDERLNLLMVRDTLETVRMAERIVALHDIPDPEVMLEVEVLEVKRTSLLDLGIRWPEQLSLAPLATTAGAAVTLADLRNLDSSRVGATVGPTTVTANKTSTDANILANPRIRAKNREKAKILIGDRVPNITSTSTSTGFVSESVNYLDVGLKLEVEPAVFPNGEVAIKLALEVSSLVKQLQTQSGTLAFQIGTRNVSTTLRLKDGENQVLAGLINDEDRRSARKIPALGDIPVAGRLFGGQADDGVKTEIVLSITPRIVRGVERPEASILEFDSGTESGGRNRGSEATGSPAPVAAPAGTPVPPIAPSAAPGASVSSGIDPRVAPQQGTGQQGDLALKLTGPLQVRGGQNVSVDLVVQSRKPYVSLPLAIAVDPSAFQVLGVIEGDVGRSNGSASRIESRIDPGGQVLVTITQPPSAASGDASGRLLTLNLKALPVNKTAAVQVLTAAGQDSAGNSLAIPLPAPLQIAVTP